MPDVTASVEAHSTPCPTGTLVAYAAGAVTIIPASCRRWACGTCGPKKARKLRDRIARATPERLITLTIRADSKRSPQDQLDDLHHAWRDVWKRIVRLAPSRPHGYVRIVEVTAQGTPHLHILATCPYVRQSTLSLWMRQLIGSPIVDIRRINNTRKAAAYVAKYLTKQTEAVAHRRRWSATAHYIPPEPKREYGEGELPLAWRWIHADLTTIVQIYLDDGWTETSGVYVRPARDGPPYGAPVDLEA